MGPRPKIPDRLCWTVSLLDVRPSDHVLEIGCGPGYAVAVVCEGLTKGTITAIDRSPIMVARARERNAGCIASGRARIERQSLVDAAFDRRFRKVFAINVNAFWTTPAPSVAALARLLHPAGAAYLAYEPPSAARLREVREWLPARLTEHGFEVSDVLTERFTSSHGLCVVGRPRT